MNPIVSTRGFAAYSSYYGYFHNFPTIDQGRAVAHLRRSDSGEISIFTPDN
jgi:hypothetical protein